MVQCYKKQTGYLDVFYKQNVHSYKMSMMILLNITEKYEFIVSENASVTSKEISVTKNSLDSCMKKV